MKDGFVMHDVVCNSFRRLLMRAVYKKIGMWQHLDESGNWRVQPLNGEAAFAVTNMSNCGEPRNWCMSGPGVPYKSYFGEHLKIVGAPGRYGEYL